MKSAPMIVDKDGKAISSTDSRSLMVYKLMNFSQEIATRYGLSSEAMQNSSDLNSRLDRAIKGLETEIGLK